MKKLLLFFKLWLLSLLISAQYTINLDPSSLGSLNYLMDSVQNWIWVSSDNQTGVETGTMIYPYNTIQEGLDAATEGMSVVVLVPIDNAPYVEALTMATDSVRLMTLEGETVTIELEREDDVGLLISGDAITLGGGSGMGFTFTLTDFGTMILMTGNEADVEISHNTIVVSYNVGGTSVGIHIGASGTTRLKIDNNEFRIAGGVSSITGIKNVDDIEITNNEFIGEDVTASGGIVLTGFYDGIIAGNYFHADTANTDHGLSYAIYLCTEVISPHASDSMEIYNNIIQDCTDGILLGSAAQTANMTEIYIYDNIIQRCIDGIHIINDAQVFPATYDIYENVFANNTTYNINNAHATTYPGSNTFDGTITQLRNTEANAYDNLIISEWTAGADMAAGGSNGIYSIVNPVEDVQNTYALRGRMDLRDAGAAVDVNQLHAIDGLVNFNESYVYDVVDNISVVGAAVHGAGADITGDGALDEESLNLYYGVWGPTATQNFEITTNGLLLMAHAATYLDYGVAVENSGTMTAGLYLSNHPSNSPATMTSGILMESAASKMTYGINMTGAGITTAEILGQNGEAIDNITDGVWNLTVPASAIVPGLTFNADVNTGINAAGGDQLSVMAGGVEAVRFVEATTTQVLVGNGTAALPSISFISDPDLGFYRSSSNIIGVTINGVRDFMFSANAFYGSNGSAGGILDEAASAINPTVIVNKQYLGTGIGSAGTDALSLIAGGVEGIRIAEGAGSIVTTLIDTTIIEEELLPDADDGANIGAIATRFNLVWADSVHAAWFGGSDFEFGASGDDITFDADTIKGAPVWDGNLVVTGNLAVAGTESKYADMYLNANGTATTMETADTPIGIRFFTTGDQNGFTFDAGGTGAITTYADYGVAAGDTVTVTDNGHGLADGDFIVIRGTTNYNGVWQIGYIDANDFYIVDTWVADDGASDWEEPSYLQLSTGTNETFDITWHLSSQKAGGASATVQWCAYKNTTPLNKTIAQRELPGTDIGSVSGGALVASVSAGDRFFLIIQSDNTNDITNRYGTLILIQE